MSECEQDFFRDTRVRYLGYANEVGESFRTLVPVKVVKASYAVAFAYVLSDTADKSWKMFKTHFWGNCAEVGQYCVEFLQGLRNDKDAVVNAKKDGRLRSVAIASGDALVWQTLASVILPGLAINRVCAYSQKYLQKNATKVPLTVRKILTVAIGLVSIPIIIHPIDNAVDLLMTLTYRKWLKPYN